MAQTLNNTATVTSTGLPTKTDTGDYTCTPPGITLTKTPKNATYNIGDNISFQMVVTSTGPGTAKNVVLNDPLPTLGNLNSWIITSNPGNGCTIAANTLNCQFGDLANGQTRSVTVATNAAGGANATACPGGVKLNNTATMTSTGLPTKTDTGDYTCTPPGITLTKTPKNATYNIGDNISFQMVVTSTGPGTAKNVVLNDPLPTLGNLNSWIITSNPGNGCTIAANTLNCSFGDLANGQTRSVTVATNAAGGANATACPGGQTLNNTATVTSTGLPTKTDTGDYTCQPGNYTLTKTPDNATYNIGDKLSFTMVVTSGGPGTAKNVVLNDPLPTLGNLNSWIITSNPGGCSLSGNTLTCSYGDLANGVSKSVTVMTTATADATACTGVKLNNVATITGTGLPTKTDTGDYTCTPGSYTLTKTPDNATYNIGDKLSFTMVVTSGGPGTAKNVVLNDPLPTLGNLNSWTITSNPGGCSLSGNTLTCSYGDLANGVSKSVTVMTTATADATACTGVKLNNVATITGTGLPTKTDTGDYTCTPPPGSFTVTKTPKNATYNIGENINFTMVVTSTGPGTARNVVLNDPLPTLGNLNSWIITSNPGNGCTIAANTLNCSFGDLANGQTRSVTVATNAAGGANATACPVPSQTLNNTATVTSTGLPPKTDTGDYTCTPPGSYTLTKTPKNATYNIGQNINFQMVVASTGPGTAKNVVLNDSLPTLGNLNSWTITINPGGCSIAADNKTLNCQFGDLANGQTRSVTVATNAAGGANAAACPGGVKLNNTATVTSNGLPPKTDTGDYTCTPQCIFCQFASPVVADAGNCTVFQLGTGKVSMSHGNPTGVYGNLCMAGGSLSMSGGQIVTGNAYLASGVNVPSDLATRVQGTVFQPFDLTAWKNAALNAYTRNNALSCDQTITVQNTAGFTINATKAGQNVICVGDISINNPIYLSNGTITQPVSFIVKVTGKIVLTGGGPGQIRVAGTVKPKDVLFNVIGTGDNVKTSGGGGGSMDTMKAIIDGTILAPYRKIGLAPGTVNGQIMSTMDISIVSGSFVNCPSCQ